jgi:hypothetical protein
MIDAPEYPELDANEIATVLAIKTDLMTITNHRSVPSEPNAVSRFGLRGRSTSTQLRPKRRWPIVITLITSLGGAIGAIALLVPSASGPTALAAQFIGAPVPTRDAQYAPTGLSDGYQVTSASRPPSIRMPAAQTLLLGRTENDVLHDYTSVDLLGPWAEPQLTQPPADAKIQTVNGHRSWETNISKEWAIYSIELECGTAVLATEPNQSDAVIRKLSALRCADTTLEILPVDNLSLLYDGPPFAQPTDSIVFLVTTPSFDSAIVSVGWSTKRPSDLEAKLATFVPTKPTNQRTNQPADNAVTINNTTGHIEFDSTNNLFRVDFSGSREPDGATARINVAGRNRDEVLTIARSVAAVADPKWETIVNKANPDPTTKVGSS